MGDHRFRLSEHKGHAPARVVQHCPGVGPINPAAADLYNDIFVGFVGPLQHATNEFQPAPLAIRAEAVLGVLGSDGSGARVSHTGTETSRAATVAPVRGQGPALRRLRAAP